MSEQKGWTLEPEKYLGPEKYLEPEKYLGPEKYTYSRRNTGEPECDTKKSM